jgi:hypothetical protein
MMQDYSNTMIPQFGWRHLLAAWAIVTAIATIALLTFGLPRAFDLARADTASHGLTNPWHDSAAHNPPSNVSDPFYRETEMNQEHAGQH